MLGMRNKWVIVMCHNFFLISQLSGKCSEVKSALFHSKIWWVISVSINISQWNINILMDLEHWLFFTLITSFASVLILNSGGFFQMAKDMITNRRRAGLPGVHMQFAGVQFPGWLSKHNIQILTLKIHISNSVKKIL